MAPEQAAGPRHLMPRVDVFALGCVLFECLTGGQPFVGDDAHAVLARTMSDPVPVEHAVAAQRKLAEAGGVEENESLIHLALPEALLAAGRADEAPPAARAALERLLSLARRASNLERREAFSNEIEPHAATSRLAHELGLPIGDR